MKGVLNYKSRTRDHGYAPFGAIHHSLYSTRNGRLIKEKNDVPSPVQKLRRGPKIKKVGQADLRSFISHCITDDQLGL